VSSTRLSDRYGILGHVIAALLLVAAVVALRGWWAQPQPWSPSILR